MKENGDATPIERSPEALRRVLDSLIPIGTEEIVAAHVRSSFADPGVAMLAARSFREGQPGIYSYIPYTAPTPKAEADENTFLCAYVRQICLTLSDRFGWVPVLQRQDLSAGDALARAILKEAPLRARVETLPVMRFLTRRLASGACDQAAPQLVKDRWVPKLLAILLCFASAYRPAPAEAPGDTQSHA